MGSLLLLRWREAEGAALDRHFPEESDTHAECDLGKEWRESRSVLHWCQTHANGCRGSSECHRKSARLWLVNQLGPKQQPWDFYSRNEVGLTRVKAEEHFQYELVKAKSSETQIHMQGLQQARRCSRKYRVCYQRNYKRTSSSYSSDSWRLKENSNRSCWVGLLGNSDHPSSIRKHNQTSHRSSSRPLWKFLLYKKHPCSCLDHCHWAFGVQIDSCFEKGCFIVPRSSWGLLRGLQSRIVPKRNSEIRRKVFEIVKCLKPRVVWITKVKLFQR